MPSVGATYCFTVSRQPTQELEENKVVAVTINPKADPGMGTKHRVPRVSSIRGRG